jgi:ATP-binding cassette, subfamily C (CFTR/MRP), member 1
MNAVERVLHYSSSEMAQEAAYEIPEKAPPADWPAQGGIVFDSVVMAYRKDLKPVLKGMSVNYCVL